MAKEQQREDVVTLSRGELDKLITNAVSAVMAKQPMPGVTVNLDASALAEAMVSSQRQVNRDAAVVYPEHQSRKLKYEAIEKEIENLDDTTPKPYLAYSLETCPHTAPTVAGHDFPKFIIKRAGKGKDGHDTAAKKVAWLSAKEVARIQKRAELKWMEIVELDDLGNPVIDPRTNLPKKMRAPYSTFIRLTPTRVGDAGKVLDDPAEVIATLQAELAQYKDKSGAEPGDPVVANAQATLDASKKEARLSEEEAEKRFAEAAGTAGVGITGVKR